MSSVYKHSMKKTLALAFCAASFLSGCAHSQLTPVEAQQPAVNPPASAPIATTVCELASIPSMFAGKTVQVPATIIINHIYEGIADPVNCRGKEVFLGDSDQKLEDAAMKQFDSALQAQFVPIKKNSTVCMYGSCHQYTVSALLVGRLDYPISELGSAAAARLELISVSQVNLVENTFDPKILRRP